ncbi:hypothetical protein B7494_g1914 [Chlorociboria aeruginascens]|nr:hypothetical protein B7494_g1914 [Chlorociboria aeruginascens]
MTSRPSPATVWLPLSSHTGIEYAQRHLANKLSETNDSVVLDVGPDRHYNLGGLFTTVRDYLRAYICSSLDPFKRQQGINEYMARFLQRVTDFGLTMSFCHPLHLPILRQSIIDWEFVASAPYASLYRVIEMLFRKSTPNGFGAKYAHADELRDAFCVQSRNGGRGIGVKLRGCFGMVPVWAIYEGKVKTGWYGRGREGEVLEGKYVTTLQFILAPVDLIMIPLLSGYLIAFVNYPSLVDTLVGLKDMKTRCGVAIAYSEFADARLNLTALVNTAFSILLGDYMFIHSHCPINSPAGLTFQTTKGGQSDLEQIIMRKNFKTITQYVTYIPYLSRKANPISFYDGAPHYQASLSSPSPTPPNSVQHNVVPAEDIGC